jgi:hypothetical protein
MPHPFDTPTQHICRGCPEKVEEYWGYRGHIELHESAEIATSSKRVLEKRVLKTRCTSQTCTRHNSVRLRRLRNWRGASWRGRNWDGGSDTRESSGPEGYYHCKNNCRTASLSQKASSILRKIDPTPGYSRHRRRHTDPTRSCTTILSREKQDGDLESSKASLQRQNSPTCSWIRTCMLVVYLQPHISG